VINVCRTKNLTGHRAKPTAIVEALSPPRLMSLDESIEYLHEDELLEVTPVSLRIRKMVLDHNIRMREQKRVKYAEA
jgi:GTP-binding protein